MRGGSTTPPPLYHGGGIILRVRPRVKRTRREYINSMFEVIERKKKKKKKTNQSYVQLYES